MIYFIEEKATELAELAQLAERPKNLSSKINLETSTKSVPQELEFVALL